MRRRSKVLGWPVGLAVACAIVGPAPAQERTPVASAPVADEQQRAVQESLAALRGVDMRRLQTERPYAEQLLVHIERLRDLSLSTGNSAGLDHLDYLRLFALPTAGRTADARAAIEAMLLRRPTQADLYVAGWYAGLRIDEPTLSITVVERASQRLRASEWPELRQYLEEPSVWATFRVMQGRTAERGRLARALLEIGWPGYHRRSAADSLRFMMVRDLLEDGNAAEASRVAEGIASPDDLLPLLTMRRYDPLFSRDEDRVARLRRGIEEFDEASAAALAAAPQDARVVLSRAQFLRGIGREADALALLEPFMRDVAATVRDHASGMWLVNEASYSLLALGRDDEAVALFERLAALPLDEHPELIGPVINRGAVLVTAGRPAEALDHARNLEAGPLDRHASDYGKLWVASTIVCALGRLDRAAEAVPWLERLRAGLETNGAALARALLCLGRLDEAETVLIRRLQEDDPEALLQALQDYRIEGTRAPTPEARHLAALRDRPAVRAAIERVGRVLSLPLAVTYWGSV